MTKIMLVEDDNNLREIYEARLAAEGYEIVSAPDGEAALALAGKERPDMIISDVMMPKISGFEMLDILRNTNALRDVKIIMLTALGQAEDSARAGSLGADRYLVKSQVTLEDIVKTAHELLQDAPEAVAAASAPAEEVAVDEPADETPEAAAKPETVAEPEAPAEAEAVEQTEAAAEPAEPASDPEEPATELQVVEPPAVETPEPETPAAELPAEPTGEPVDAPEQVAPEPVAPVVPEPTAEPATVASPEVPEPPVQTAPVINIPVIDDSSPPDTAASDDSATDDDQTPVAMEPAASAETVAPPTEPSENLHPVSGLPYTPEPAEAPEAPEPNASVAVTPDYTSPESFNIFQTDTAEEAPAAESSAPAEPVAPSADPEQAQTSADEEASIKSQIDAFISQQESMEVQEAPVTEPEAAEPEAAAEPEKPAADLQVIEPPATETPEPETPTAELPVEATESPEPAAPETPEIPEPPQEPETPESPEQPAAIAGSGGYGAASPLDSLTHRSAPDQAEPEAESLDNFSGPVITPPEQDTVPQPAIDEATGLSDDKLRQLLALEDSKSAAQQAASENQPKKPNVDAYNAPNIISPQNQPPKDVSSDPDSISL